MIDRLENYLAGSPLEGQGRKIYLASVDSSVDPVMVAAMANLESSKGRYLAGRYNPFGRKAVGGGWMQFSSFEAAIENQAVYLRRYYLDEGRNTPESIAAKYAPASDGNVDYAGKLRREMSQI
jgi:peptidoglycan DL-endopeptidase CwlO